MSADKIQPSRSADNPKDYINPFAAEAHQDTAKNEANTFSPFLNMNEGPSGNHIADASFFSVIGGGIGGLAIAGHEEVLKSLGSHELFSTGFSGEDAIFKGAAKGAGVAVAGALLDTGLNTLFPSIARHKGLFAPTGVEALGVGMAAAAPIDSLQLKATLVGAAWLGGRIYNYFER